MNLTTASGVEAPANGFLAQVFAKESAPAPTPQADATPPPTPEADSSDEPIITPPAASEKKAAPAKEEKKGLDALIEDDEAEPAKEEPKPEDDQPPADVKTKEAREAWKRGRIAEKKLPTLEKELAELKAKLEASSKLSDADPLKQEIETLRKRDEEREKEAAIWRIERTSAYKNAVTKPLENFEKSIVALAKEHQIEQNSLIDAMTIRDRKERNAKIAELTDMIPEADRFELYQIAGNGQVTLAKRDELEANAHTAYVEATAREKEEAEKSTTERRASEMRAVIELKPKLMAAAKLLAQEGETPEAYVERIVSKVNTVPFDEHDASNKAFMGAAAELLVDMAPAYKKALKEIEALKKQVSGMSASSPRTSSGNPGNSGDAAKPSGFFEAFTGNKPRWAQHG